MSLRNRPEYVADITMNTALLSTAGIGAPQEQGLVNRIPLDKPLWGALLDVRFRLATVVGTGAEPNVNSEGALNFIQRVRVVGTHKRFGTREIVNLRGATLYALEKKYSFGMAAPVVSNLPAAGSPLVTATNYDVNYVIPCPFVPRGIPKLQQMLFLIRNDEWATFDVYITFGDLTSIAAAAIGGTGTATFTDFASASGTPKVRVSVIRCILGEARGMIQPAILRRQFLPLTSVLTAAALTDAPIQDLDVGFKVHAYLLKTGVQTTTGTGGTNSYSSLSDSIVVRPKIKLDNVVIKDNVDDLTARTYNIIEFGYGGTAGVLNRAASGNDTGYVSLDFVEGKDLNAAFRGDMLNRSNKLQLAGDVTSAANQQGELVEEMLEGEPNLYSPSTAGK